MERYLTLLENAYLKGDEPILLGDYVLKYMKPEELSEDLYCRPLESLVPLDRQRVDLYSEWLWALRETDSTQEAPKGNAGNWDRAFQQHELMYRHAGKRHYWPFDELIQTLNLLKSSDGPVMPIQFYHITPEARESRTRVESIVHGEPTANEDQEGNQWPYLAGYELLESDVADYQALAEKLAKALRKAPDDGDLPNGHIWIAVDYFERANRSMSTILDRVPTVLLYEFALEALYISEEERGSERRLKDRIPMAVCTNDTIELSALTDFIGDVFWIRSKAAHGVQPIRELEQRMQKANTRDLFFNGGALSQYLVNLREIVRRSIRYFVDKYAEGISRSDILQELDNTSWV